jgi:phage gpG-like protein
MAKNITPAQLLFQWTILKYKFHVNMWDFEVEAGKAAEKVFKDSFTLGRFNSNGSTAWPPRKNPKASHPILYETRTLQRSITNWPDRRKKQIRIYTDPTRFGTAARHAGFCYAAVHNAPDGAGFRRGKAANIAQRQFIGHSTVLRDELKRLEPMLFAGFPGVTK